jgi:Ca2+-transporting ATPase
MAISFFVGKNITAFTIMAVIAMVVITGFIQEYKAEKAIEYLKKMVTYVSRVIRNGKEAEILSKDIVPGDILIIRMGERVPADCVIIELNELTVNEAVLTGEACEVAKAVPPPYRYL